MATPTTLALSPRKGRGQPNCRGKKGALVLTWADLALPLFSCDLRHISGGSDEPAKPAVKNLPAMWETRVQSLSWEGPLEKGMATHSSILAWRIPWTEEPGGLLSMGSQRIRDY